MDNQLQGKVAIVSGGSRGIGREIVLSLARQGCHVAFNYVHSAEPARQLAEEVAGLGVRCLSAQVDITDFEAVKDWCGQIKQEFGTFHYVVNNAGIIDDKPLMMMSRDQWKRVIDTNLNGMFNLTRHCVVTLMKQKFGSIVNVSSVSGVMGLPGQTNYSASKGGMNAFTKALAQEVAGSQVRVNAVAPGFIDTDIVSHFAEDKREYIQSRIPQGRIGRPADVSGCVSYLLGSRAAYVTGQVIVIDGGLSLR